MDKRSAGVVEHGRVSDAQLRGRQKKEGGIKKGQEPIAKWPVGCSALLVPDPFFCPARRVLRTIRYRPLFLPLAILLGQNKILVVQEILPRSSYGEDLHGVALYDKQQPVRVASSGFEQSLFQINPDLVGLRGSRAGNSRDRKLPECLLERCEPLCGSLRGSTTDPRLNFEDIAFCTL